MWSPQMWHVKGWCQCNWYISSYSVIVQPGSIVNNLRGPSESSLRHEISPHPPEKKSYSHIQHVVQFNQHQNICQCLTRVRKLLLDPSFFLSQVLILQLLKVSSLCLPHRNTVLNMSDKARPAPLNRTRNKAQIYEKHFPRFHLCRCLGFKLIID